MRYLWRLRPGPGTDSGGNCLSAGVGSVLFSAGGTEDERYDPGISGKRGGKQGIDESGDPVFGEENADRYHL